MVFVPAVHRQADDRRQEFRRYVHLKDTCIPTSERKRAEGNPEERRTDLGSLGEPRELWRASGLKFNMWVFESRAGIPILHEGPQM